jgi:hypothetical protein
MSDIVEYAKTKLNYDYLTLNADQRQVVESLYNKDNSKSNKKPNQWLSFTSEATKQLKQENQISKISLKDIQIRAHELAEAAGYQYKKKTKSKEILIN